MTITGLFKDWDNIAQSFKSKSGDCITKNKNLLDYTMYIKKKGIEVGNKGGLTSKLRRLRAVCSHAKKMEMNGINMDADQCLGDNIKWYETTSKAVSAQNIYKIENIDRSLFSAKELLHLNLFLFSYYTGGMANVDVCNFTWDCIKDGKIIYERIKFPNIAQKTSRVKQLSTRVSETLTKACKILKIKENITWYSARGSFISRIVDEGYSPYTVAEMAGNSQMVIYKHYYKTPISKRLVRI